MTQPAPQDAVGVPVCPRHPDRESYVRCQRCERPACPDCQRPAAVGVHCVDCVREAGRTVPRTRTAFGARHVDGRPVITFTIIGLCALLYVGQLAIPGLTERLALVPYLSPEEPWRMLTSAFLHDPGWFVHILFNMYALFLLGPYLEQLFGRVLFVVTYLLSAIGGSAVFDVLVGDVTEQEGVPVLTVAVGASGAVFGLFGALVVVQRKLNRDLGQIAVLLGLNLVLGFVVPRIAWEAHLGGFLVGLLCAAAIAYAPKANRRLVQVGGLALVAGLVVALSAVGFALQAPLVSF